MAPKIIRSLENSEESKLELVLDDSDIFWITDGKKARNQQQLFAQYNPLLSERLSILKAYKQEIITQRELAKLLKLDPIQLRHYFNDLRPELHPEKREPITLENVYEMLKDFMPIIEQWQTCQKFAKKNHISASTVRNHCRENPVENKFFLHTYWISPRGEIKLKELLNLQYSLARKWGNTFQVATALGISQSTVADYCRAEKIPAKKYQKGWRIPFESANSLRNSVRKREASFVFAGETYNSLIDIAKQTVEERQITDPNAEVFLLKRFYHLRDEYPQQFPSIKKRQVFYVNEKTGYLLRNLMTQVEASRALGIDRYRVRTLMRKGILDRLTFSPTAWTTYSSVMAQKHSSS